METESRPLYSFAMPRGWWVAGEDPIAQVVMQGSWKGVIALLDEIDAAKKRGTPLRVEVNESASGEAVTVTFWRE